MSSKKFEQIKTVINHARLQGINQNDEFLEF